LNDQLKTVISVSSEICAVITTYRPDDDFLSRVQRIRSQVGHVVIVDDGESADNVARLKSWFSGISSVTLCHNVVNVGVAISLNKGISIAKSKGYRWVLTLDDDTIVNPDMVKNLIETWNLVADQAGKPVAIMGMARSGGHDDRIESCPTERHLFVEKRGIITSGSLMPLDVYDAIGGFRDEFFIDSIDYDYCLRARAKGFRVIEVCRFGMIHPLGNTIKRCIGCLTLKTTNHTPIRRYYAYRNSTVLAQENFRHDPLYSLAVFVYQLRTVALILLLENDRRKKVKMIFRGLLDGWRKRLGKLIPVE
jgi:rhamnosyltransferase